MQRSDINRYLDLANRRKWWFILPFLLTLLGGLGAVLKIPKIYEAKTVVLVQRQKVPEHYVQEIVSTDLPDRLRLISQQVTSRTNLEAIIAEHQLYSQAGGGDLILERRTQKLRQRIEIDIVEGRRRGSAGNSFSISFRDEDPEKAKQVTNALASNFISENLKIRETQAIGTSAFLSDELDSVKKRLTEKEERLKSYRKKHIGSMPENLQTNLSMLSRYQEELEELNENLRDAQNRKLIVQKQVAEAEEIEQQRAAARESGALVSSATAAGGGRNAPDELSSLRRKLMVLESRYTDKHPDIRKLKTVIAELEKERAAAGIEEPASVPRAQESMAPLSGLALLKEQLAEIEAAITGLRAEINNARARRSLYQQRVEETPEREQELISIRRDYDNLKSLYDSLLDRKLEAEISVNLEKKQKGEQFRIIDLAKAPKIPVEPDVRKILMLTLVLALAMGGGMAYMRETMDSSYKSPDEIESGLQLPVLVSMPIRRSPAELRRIKARQIVAAASVAVGFVFSAAVIVVAVKGMDKTVDFAKDLLTNLPFSPFP